MRADDAVEHGALSVAGRSVPPEDRTALAPLMMAVPHLAGVARASSGSSRAVAARRTTAGIRCMRVTLFL